jgi:hypothetical protein
VSPSRCEKWDKLLVCIAKRGHVARIFAPIKAWPFRQMRDCVCTHHQTFWATRGSVPPQSGWKWLQEFTKVCDDKNV